MYLVYTNQKVSAFMSKIVFYEGKNGCSPLFFKVLQDKINIVCERIGFDDSGVLWIIFNPVSRYRNTIHHAILGGSCGMDYGFTIPDMNQIWISTRAISSEKWLPTTKVMGDLLWKSASRDLLTDVILDEITHIQTGLDHGDEDYEYRLKVNVVKCYFHR